MTSTTTTSLATTPFGFDSTAAEVVAGVDLGGRRAIVTGASSGIGIETARGLASAGADITLAVRDTVAGARTAAHITATTGNDTIHVARLDLARPGLDRHLCQEVERPTPHPHQQRGRATDQTAADPGRCGAAVATNHLGHFALAIGLHNSLTAASGARVVSLSSEAHLRAPLVFDDLNFASRPYDPMLAYGQSKTANVLFAVEAARRWAGDGISANAVHPGAVIQTNLARDLDPDILAAAIETAGYEYKTREQGAATSVLVATSPLLEGISGRYFADCNEAPVVDSTFTGPPRGFGVAPYGLDPDNGSRLWDLSLDLTD